MNPATREKLILMLFPAAIVALVWWGWFLPTSKLAAREKSVAAARASTPSPDKLLQEKALQTKAQREVAELKLKKQDYLRRWDDLRRDLSQKENRPQALERLAHVFHQRELTILHETPTANSSAKTSARGLEELHRKLNQPVETAFPELKVASAKTESRPALAAREVWEIDFAGEYPNVQAALAQLNEDGELVPISLRMVEADASLKLRRWTLVISL